MNKSKRKYLSEFALNIHTGGWTLMPASDLAIDNPLMPDDSTQGLLDNSHIYLLSKLPRLSFSPNRFQYKNNVISGDFTFKVEGKEKLVPFEFSPNPSSDITNIELSPYPHREILMKDSNGDAIRFIPASLLFFSFGFHTKFNEIKNLEVLYVGQAYADGKRSAVDRLKNHSTLQKILANFQYSSPDYEIYILMYEYMDPVLFTSMDGRSKAQITDYRDINRFHSIVDNPPTKKQVISLMEAGLIRYFQPKYNKIYKENFPSTSHEILKGCYALDFSALVVEINSEDLGFSLYSDNIKPSSHHISKIELIDPDKRWGFFHISDGEDAVKSPDVITIKK